MHSSVRWSVPRGSGAHLRTRGVTEASVTNLDVCNAVDVRDETPVSAKHLADTVAMLTRRTIAFECVAGPSSCTTARQHDTSGMPGHSLGGVSRCLAAPDVSHPFLRRHIPSGRSLPAVSLDHPCKIKVRPIA